MESGLLATARGLFLLSSARPTKPAPPLKARGHVPPLPAQNLISDFVFNYFNFSTAGIFTGVSRVCSIRCTMRGMCVFNARVLCRAKYPACARYDARDVRLQYACAALQCVCLVNRHDASRCRSLHTCGLLSRSLLLCSVAVCAAC